MKQISILIALFIGVFFWSCEKKPQNQDYPFQGKILGINIDCGIHEINITDGLDKVIELCGSSIGNVYIVGNLPDSLKKEGLIIQFNIGKPTPGQFTACTTLGPSYNWIWITDARPK